jgi:hypothetical protein
LVNVEGDLLCLGRGNLAAVVLLQDAEFPRLLLLLGSDAV